jgi:hypothetical protein
VLEAELARHYGPARRWYEQVRPGMTGLWQVSGRNRLDHARRVALDVDYAADLRLGRDLAILARTVPAVLRGGGATAAGGRHRTWPRAVAGTDPRVGTLVPSALEAVHRRPFHPSVAFEKPKKARHAECESPATRLFAPGLLLPRGCRLRATACHDEES